MNDEGEEIMDEQKMEEVEIEDDIPFIKTSSAKELLNKEENLPFKGLVKEVFSKLKKRKWLNPTKTLDEVNKMENVIIDIKDFNATDTDLRTFFGMLSKIDALKSRLSDILADAQNDCDVLDTWYKELRDIWIARSSGKSADKRDGEATEILVFLTNERLVRRGVLNKVKSKFGSMSSKMDAISREITIGQELRRNPT